MSRSAPAPGGSLGWPYGSDRIPRPLTHDIAIGRIKQHFYSYWVGELPLQLGNMGTIINLWNRCKLYSFWSRYHCMDMRRVPFWSQTSWYESGLSQILKKIRNCNYTRDVFTFLWHYPRANFVVSGCLFAKMHLEVLTGYAKLTFLFSVQFWHSYIQYVRIVCTTHHEYRNTFSTYL